MLRSSFGRFASRSLRPQSGHVETGGTANRGTEQVLHLRERLSEVSLMSPDGGSNHWNSECSLRHLM